jgi:hypothetical protein
MLRREGGRKEKERQLAESYARTSFFSKKETRQVLTTKRGLGAA